MSLSHDEVRGNVDLVSATSITGWAFLAANPLKRLLIRVRARGVEVAQGMADCKRADLIDGGIADGSCSFVIRWDEDVDVGSLTVLAEDPDTGRQRWLSANGRSVNANKRSGYQTFSDQQGDSDSKAKLQALRLPQSFSGKEVLDLGCNEGFFCMESLQRGATRVVGIDSNESVIRLARQRDEKSEYRVSTWWDLPDGSFDFIFFLSAIHYETRQKELLERIAAKLKPGGSLVLECGVGKGAGKSWSVVKRHDGFLRYPTWDLLREELLAPFAVTTMGPSVTQPGDPVPRFVFHCTPRRRTYLLISGKPLDGKSHFGEILTKQSGGLYSTDSFFYSVKAAKENQIKGDPFLERIWHECNVDRIDECVESIVEQGNAEQLARHILERAPLECDLTVIEGHALSSKPVEEAIVRELESKGGVVWRAARTRSESFQ